MLHRFKPISKNDLIFVTGANGMVGSAIIRCLNQRNYKKILKPDSLELDLRNQNDVESYLEKHKPDFVLIELGGNDGMRGYPIEEIKNNLVKISKAIAAANAVPLIMQIKIPPNYGKRYVTAFENIFSQVAEEQNLSMLTFLLEKVALNKELMQQDGIHPNKAAQPLIADQVKTELLKFIK